MMTRVKLRPYQERILKELKDLGSIGLFMGTGTGKTITSLFRVRENKTKHLLVLCPSKVVQQWKAEIPKVLDEYEVYQYGDNLTVTNLNQLLISDLSPKLDSNTQYALVISLESLYRASSVQRLVDEDWTIILDESHKIKEVGTRKKPVKVTQAALNLANKTNFKIILTATPTQKEKGGYVDYYTQLRFLGYMDMSYDSFKQRYCIMKKIQPIGMPFPIQIIDKYKNTSEIENILMLTCRRYVANFGDFEPQHIKIMIPQAKSYARLNKDKVYNDLDLTHISLRRLAKKTLTGGVIMGRDIFGEQLVYLDNDEKASWVESFLEGTDESVVIFYKYNTELEVLRQVCKRLGKKVIIINGKTKNKYSAINDNDYDVILGQFAACGESVDGIQRRTHICIYYAMPESSLEHTQALGRINRDGQDKVPIYYYLVMEKTIDAQIYDLTEKKIEFSESILDKLSIEEEKNDKTTI